MYRQLDEVMHESPWTMMFTYDMLICSEKREQVEENLVKWRHALERRDRMHVCGGGGGVLKVDELKYLGSAVQSN